MLVDKTEFEAWMERIMGELYRISRKLDKAENRQKHLNYLNGERLYDNQEVCQLLRISKRTLQRYRNNGALKFIQYTTRPITRNQTCTSSSATTSTRTKSSVRHGRTSCRKLIRCPKKWMKTAGRKKQKKKNSQMIVDNASWMFIVQGYSLPL